MCLMYCVKLMQHVVIEFPNDVPHRLDIRLKEENDHGKKHGPPPPRSSWVP